MKKQLTKKIINKYISDEFGNIPNPPTKDEMVGLINNDELTLEGVKLWKLFGGNLLIKDKHGDTILHIASYMGQLDIIQYVLDKGVDVDCLNNYKQTPLMYALWNNHIEVVNYLLERGANINYQCDWGWSALHYACDRNQLEVVKTLVYRGIHIDLKNNNNETALDKAKSKGYQEIIDYLTPYYKTK